jgi:glycerophosphoryl diester phosphodiesterase
MSDLSWITAKPIAHRGLHDKANGIIENTISAAKAAIAKGFSIECDVQLTADGEAIVFHDFELDRLTDGTGPVVDRKLSDLTTIGITGAVSDTIPSFKAFLDAIGGRVPLVVEIKSKFDGDMRLTERTCAMLKDYRGPFVIKSFDPQVVAKVREIAPEVIRGIIAQRHYESKSDGHLSADLKHNLANLLHLAQSRPQFLSWHVKDLPSGIPYLCQQLGQMPVMAWTVRTPEDRALAAKYADQMVFEGFLP